LIEAHAFDTDQFMAPKHGVVFAYSRTVRFPP
jgi:hypothetical protein